MDIKRGYIPSGNARLYYELAGDGPGLVFIHAGVADSRQWNHEFAHFARDRRVLRYDQRGFGKSLPVEGEFSHMADLLSLLDQLDLREPLTLVGCSMGGGLALDFALEQPERVKALVMVGSLPSGIDLDDFNYPGSAHAGLSLEQLIHPLEEAAEQAQEAGDLDLAAELETQVFFDGMGRTPSQVNQEMRSLALEMNRLGKTHAAQELGKQKPNTEIKAMQRLDQLQIPLLLVVGEHDEPVVHAGADYLVAHVPGACKVVLPDAAHLANMDHPEQFQQALRSFLDEVDL